MREEDALKIELKQLPSNLRYIYLGPNSTYHIIFNAYLNDEQIGKLLIRVNDHTKIIRYTIDDLKGISPSFYMHRIHLEEGHKFSIENQRRLNPNIKEVVKKDIMKLLNV